MNRAVGCCLCVQAFEQVERVIIFRIQRERRFHPRHCLCAASQPGRGDRVAEVDAGLAQVADPLHLFAQQGAVGHRRQTLLQLKLRGGEILQIGKAPRLRHVMGHGAFRDGEVATAQFCIVRVIGQAVW